jgi:hypothetical protein
VLPAFGMWECLCFLPPCWSVACISRYLMCICPDYHVAAVWVYQCSRLQLVSSTITRRVPARRSSDVALTGPRAQFMLQQRSIYAAVVGCVLPLRDSGQSTFCTILASAAVLVWHLPSACPDLFPTGPLALSMLKQISTCAVVGYVPPLRDLVRSAFRRCPPCTCPGCHVAAVWDRCFLPSARIFSCYLPCTFPDFGPSPCCSSLLVFYDTSAGV